ncbi:MAG: DUF6600 domain-containing protein [Verrucomicrobiales bacterium]
MKPLTALLAAGVVTLGVLAGGVIWLNQPQPEPTAAPAPAAASTSPDPAAEKAEAERLKMLAERSALEAERLALEAERARWGDAADEALAREEAALAAEAAAIAAAEKAEEAAAAEPVPAPAVAVSEPVISLGPEVESDPGAPFYDELEPWGDWIDSPDYGTIWQPDLAVDASWSPYSDGSWGYSDYGWTWISNEPFGWATYHYGRWVLLDRCGWCWVPGLDWAPSWVSWRVCDDYVAWAPLPPAARWHASLGIGGWVDASCGIGPAWYNVISVSHFNVADCRSRLIPRRDCAPILARTRNVTRLHCDDGDRLRRIRCDGPDFVRLAERCPQPIRRFALEPHGGREKADGGRATGSTNPATSCWSKTGTTPSARAFPAAKRHRRPLPNIARKLGKSIGITQG